MTAIIERQRMDRRIVELLILGRGVKSICKELHVGKDRVREVRERAKARGYLDKTLPLPPAPEALFDLFVDHRVFKSSSQDELLLSRMDFIRDHLTAGWKPVTVFEELECASLSRSSFYRFLERHELYKLFKNYRAPSLIAPIIHTPGEALILDWGKLCDVITRETVKRTLWAFVGVLGFSRYMMVRLVWTNDVSSTFDAIESMLREIGGVTKRATSDNPKCFSLAADIYDPLLNPAFVRFSSHYDFTVECLPPADPEKKGKVERQMPFARRLFEAYPNKKDWISLEHAQEYMDRKVFIANQRKHGTTCLKPVEVFEQKEKVALKPLPPLSYEREEVSYPTVRRDGFTRFANKYYAVEDEYINQEMVVLGTNSQVSIYYKGTLLHVYPRITDPYETHAMKEHLKKGWQKIKENNRHYLKKAEQIGPNTYGFVHALIEQGQGFVDTRKIWGVFSLEKRYPITVIDWACGIATQRSELSFRFVAKMASLFPHKNELESQENSVQGQLFENHKFVRPMTDYKKQIYLKH